MHIQIKYYVKELNRIMVSSFTTEVHITLYPMCDDLIQL